MAEKPPEKPTWLTDIAKVAPGIGHIGEKSSSTVPVVQSIAASFVPAPAMDAFIKQQCQLHDRFATSVKGVEAISKVAAFGAAQEPVRPISMQDHPRLIVIHELLQALERALAHPLVIADPQTVADVQALYEAVGNLPVRRAMAPGTVLEALAKPGQQRAGQSTGGQNADTEKRRKLAGVVATLPKDPAQRPPFAQFLAACIATTGYTSDGTRKALKSAHGIEPW